MSLKVLLRCSGDEFERLISLMDLQSVLDVISELQTEMDREQKKFDCLTENLSQISDHSSVRYKKLSGDLIRSQNRLALLITRNMHCFKVSQEPEEDEVENSSEDEICLNVDSCNMERVNGDHASTHISTISTCRVDTVQSTAVLNVTSPRTHSNNKPKRVLTIRTTKLSKDKISSNQNQAADETLTLTDCIKDQEVVGHTLPASPPLSARSDLNHTSTPRSCTSGTPTIPVSSILQLDIPETSIDSNGNSCVLSSPAGGDGDKISFTTDESGFTSGSSDSDTVLAACDIVYDYLYEEEEKLEEKIFMRNWNPSKLLAELYFLQLAQEPCSPNVGVVNMEGYLERMPIGKDKNTLLKTWKRTFCKAVNGMMYFHNKKDSEMSQSCMSLMGGKVEELSNRMLGIDDMRGHYLMVRCANNEDYINWRRCFDSQIRCSPHTNYIQPCLTHASCEETTPKVVVIDLGSASIRAGVAGSKPSYPQIFFPLVTSIDKQGQVVIGAEAYEPQHRKYGLHRPIATCKDTNHYRVNLQVFPPLFEEIFTRLEINIQDYVVLLSTPHNFSLRLKEEMTDILMKQQVAGVFMVNQSLLVPYAYNATSGIVVDVGERIDIISVMDGYLVEGVSNRQTFGGAHITDNLNSYLTDYRLFSSVEQLIPRLIKEKTCFVSQDYGDDLLKYMCEEKKCEVSLDLNTFDFPAESHFRHVSVDTARFKAAEGLIKTELKGEKRPTLPQLICEAIQSCPLNVRREMWQSVYLSGGTTLMKGFAERLQKELGKMVSPSITVQVHASPHRYHAAYIGACVLARMPTFLASCITRDEWNTNGHCALTKWKPYFQG